MTSTSGLADWPFPTDSIHYVDSVDSPAFAQFISALGRSIIVAMDAEWKPNFSSNKKKCHRVSVMQLACRLRTDEDGIVQVSASSPSTSGSDECISVVESQSDEQKGSVSEFLAKEQLERADDPPILSSNDNDDDGDDDVDSVANRFNTLGLDEELSVKAEAKACIEEALKDSTDNPESEVDSKVEIVTSTESEDVTLHLDDILNKAQAVIRSCGNEYMEKSLERLKERQEMVFLVDMLALPVASYWEHMKRMLVSPSVLKLGFRFKQDLLNLSSSFPGPDAHCCFDKVDPYVDIGKLYTEVRGYNRLPYESLSLSTICEKVVGYTLCKELQCSNWEQRPLTLEQMVYSASDAHCLLVVYDMLGDEALKDCGLHYHSDSTSAKDGLVEVLLNQDNKSSGILHARHGIASDMVKHAVSHGIVSKLDLLKANTSTTFTHIRIARQFGEKLLVNGEGSVKVAKKKSKSRKGRKGDQMETHSWFGPPPWDLSCGGDGCPKFLCDSMMEGLAKQLRNVGIDTQCPHGKKPDPRELVEWAEKEGRVLLTQDVKLLRRRLIPGNLAYRVRSNGKQEQLAEVVKKFNLIILEDNLLSRCNKCNGHFIPRPLTPEEALASVTEGQSIPEYAINDRLLFWQCSQCMHMYWQGNQFHRALETFQAFARKVQESQ